MHESSSVCQSPYDASLNRNKESKAIQDEMFIIVLVTWVEVLNFKSFTK